YTPISGTLTFNAGELVKTITVLVKGDTRSEGNETFFVSLSNLVNATMVDSLGVGTITNDDANPTIAISDTTVLEPTAGTVNAVFTVSLSNESDLTTTIKYTTTNGTALTGSDFTATSGILTFGPGVTTQTINVPVL